MAWLDAARGRRFVAGEQFDQRRLARTVHTHQRHTITALDGEADVVENLLWPVALREAFRLDHHASRGRRLRKLEVDDRLFFRNLDALNLFELFNARLHLLGLGRLGAKAIDEGLKMLDLDALIAIGRLKLRAPLVFLTEIFGVVALVNIEAPVPDLDGSVDGHVEKIAIVRDEDVAEGIVLEIILKPVAG